jgi:hypothetical protein
MATHRDIFLAGGQSNCQADWYNNILARIVGAGLYANPEMSVSYHSGQNLTYWWNAGRGENYLTDWYKGDGTATLEARLAQIAAAGETATIRALFWFQGEGDSGYDSLTSAYLQRFTDMRAQLLVDLSLASLPVYPVLIWSSSMGADADRYATLRNTILPQIAANTSGLVIDSANYPRRDVVHLTNDAGSNGYIMLGISHGDLFLGTTFDPGRYAPGRVSR